MSIYMKIEGPNVPGMASDSNHKDWIPVITINHDVTRPLASREGLTGQSAVQFRDIVITTKMGKHVPELARYCSSGTDFNTVTLEVCTDQGGGVREAYYTIKLTKAIVTHLGIANNGDGGVQDMVTLGLNFQKIEWKFVQWDGKTKVGTTSAGWDVKENKLA
jgi:type VI secretion system secreted protein Hcp